MRHRLQEPGRLFTIALRALLSAGLALAALVLLGFFEDSPLFDAGLDAYYLVAVGVSAATVLAGLRPGQRPWLLIGVAFGVWTIGGIDYGLSGQPTHVSAADVLWVLFYPPMLAGMLALTRRQVAHVDSRLWLDGAVAAVGLASVALLLALPLILHGHVLDSAKIAFCVASPVADLLLLGLVVATITASRGHTAREWLVVGFGVAVLTTCDITYLVQIAVGSFHPGGPVTGGWLLGMLVLCYAAWMPQSPTPAPRRDSESSLRWPLLLAGLPIAVLVVRGVPVAEAPAVALAAAALVGLLARLALTHTDLHTAMQAVTEQALTDPLTGLANRERLLKDLARALEGDSRRALILFDLDGFKTYNDSFGHVAGDILLRDLAGALARCSAREDAIAYRMGGDEFCVLSARLTDVRQAPVESLRAALHRQGEGFLIRASAGCALLGVEAGTPSDVLCLADERMYAEKNSGRPPAGVQAKEVLLSALAEHEHSLEAHSRGVASMAAAVCRVLGLSAKETERISLAAELHDVGKVAIPEALLHKRGALSPEEWVFVRQHTLIGERIARSAPSLRALAPLIRSAHERWDGTGYPDGLAGEDIPLGAQIIFACDAYDAITAERPYSARSEPEQARAEIQRCAGSQFAPRVAAAFAEVCAQLDAADRAAELQPSGACRAGATPV